MNAKSFFLYARKSTDDAERQVRSIDDQIAELRDLARKERLTISRVFIEKQTAKVPGRPIFNEMLDCLEKGEASGILAWHPDRLARNSIDGGRIIYMVDTGRIASLKFFSIPFDPSPSGKFMLSIMFGQSKYYVDNLSENIRRGQRQKLKNGIWPQFSPIGYLNDRNTRTIVPDPERAPLVRQLFELFATGEVTLDRLKATLNGLGMTTRRGKPLSRSQYHRLLRNPIYYGVIRYQGELYDGKHEPIIAKNLFDKVQQVIRNKRKRHGRVLKPYVYRGLFRCDECGCAITIETQKGHNYLHCTRKKGPCSQRFVREEAVTNQIQTLLAPLALPKDWIDWMSREADRERREQSIANEEELTFLRTSIAACEQKLKRLTDAYLEGVLTVDEYRETKTQLVEKKADLTGNLGQLEKNPTDWLEPAERFLKALSKATLCIQGGDTGEKAKLLKKTGSNLNIRDRTLCVEFKEPWKTTEKHGRFAQPETRASVADARVVGEIHHVFTSAERGRFELP